MKLKIIFFLVLFPILSYAQTKYYNFNAYEGENYIFTMNQSNDLSLNSQRFIGSLLVDDNSLKWKKIGYHTVQALFDLYVGQALTHEEGHRSVLSELGIHSIDEPFPDKQGVSKVTGVSDATLKNLRDTDLPNYIRLHNGGLESDYGYLKKLDADFNFNEESYNVMYWDYVIRKVGVGQYFFSLLSPGNFGIKEQDTPELKRDIVGHDIYGMIRHLHRPTMEFYRYTEWDNLTAEEKAYGKRMGMMSLLNILNPNIFRIDGFNLANDIKANFSVNYSLAPFGDFTEQNAYLTIKDKYKINPYFRQYFNKSYTFLAGGINLHNYAFNDDKFLLNSSFDFWQQPKNQEFRSNIAEFGLGLKSELGIRFSSWNSGAKSAYFNIGASYKMNGFIPEAPSLREDFRIHLGLIVSVKD